MFRAQGKEIRANEFRKDKTKRAKFREGQERGVNFTIIGQMITQRNYVNSIGG